MQCPPAARHALEPEASSGASPRAFASTAAPSAASPLVLVHPTTHGTTDSPMARPNPSAGFRLTWISKAARLPGRTSSICRPCSHERSCAATFDIAVKRAFAHGAMPGARVYWRINVDGRGVELLRFAARNLNPFRDLAICPVEVTRGATFLRSKTFSLDGPPKNGRC